MSPITSGRSQYRASPESEARILILIDAFSRLRGGAPRQLEGRVKLAKLDFLLRYPHHLARILTIRGVSANKVAEVEQVVDTAPIDSRMMRYRYGPWDPAYYALLGALIGRGLVQALPLAVGSGYGYRTTEAGARLAAALRADESFAELSDRAEVLRSHLDKSGTTLKDLLYRLPEVSDATWKEGLE
jgi:hypothetical protein